jgi:hypothetical protein
VRINASRKRGVFGSNLPLAMEDVQERDMGVKLLQQDHQKQIHIVQQDIFHKDVEIALHL